MALKTQVPSLTFGRASALPCRERLCSRACSYAIKLPHTEIHQ